MHSFSLVITLGFIETAAFLSNHITEMRDKTLQLGWMFLFIFPQTPLQHFYCPNFFHIKITRKICIFVFFLLPLSKKDIFSNTKTFSAQLSKCLKKAFTCNMFESILGNKKRFDCQHSENFKVQLILWSQKHSFSENNNAFLLNASCLKASVEIQQDFY